MAVAFGLYMLVLLVHGVSTFRTVPEAELELKRVMTPASVQRS